VPNSRELLKLSRAFAILFRKQLTSEIVTEVMHLIQGYTKEFTIFQGEVI
jgi:hypothetical protein